MSLRRRVQAALKSKSGATAVEYAMIAPVLFALLTGVFETSRFFYVRSALQKAVDDAGRYAMRNTSASDAVIIEIARQNLIDPVNDAADVKVSRDTVSGTDFVSVTVDYTFTPLASIVPIGSIPVSLLSRVPLIN